jgi:uncharacterized membrane protein
MSASASRKPSESLLRILAGLVGLVGLGIASYIMVNEVRGELVACGREGGCETVLNSKYAEIFGVPLYFFGVAGYVSILGATALSGDRGRLLAFVLSFFGFGVSAYLTFLQYVVIESICVWCRGSAIAMTVLFLVCLARLLLYYGTDEPGADDIIDRADATKPADSPSASPVSDQPT